MKKVIPFLAFLLLSTGTYAQWTQAPKLPVPAPIERLDIDGSTLYAATAYPMVGVYKSVNNGASWAKLNIDNLNEYYAIVSASGNTVIVFDFGPLHYSTDGGATFQDGGSPDFGYLTAMLADGNNVLALDYTNGLYLSTDQGATFTNTNVVPPGNYNYGQIIQTPVGKILIYTAFDMNYEMVGNFVYRSTDNVNWTAIDGSGGSNPLPTKQNGFETYYYYTGYANGAILAGSYNIDSPGALYKSTDLGANWSPVSPSLFGTEGTILASNGSRAFVSSYPNTYTSTDLVTWTDVSNQVRPYGVYDGSASTFVGLNRQGWIALSTNGTTWPATSGQIYGNTVVMDYLSAGGKDFLATPGHGVFRGTGNDPANMSWTKVLGSGVSSGSDFCWDLLKKGNVLLAGLDYWGDGQNGIFRSTNNGNSWTRTYTGTGLSFCDDGAAVYAGIYHGGIVKSTNSGQTWTEVNDGLPTSPSYLRSPLALLKAGNNLVAGFINGGIYTSSNNGASWVQRSTQFFIYCLAKAGSTLFAGTQGGLMKSTDQGETWTFVQNDLLGIAVSALYVGEDNVLYLGTGVSGMYRSTDGGETLEPHSDGVGNNTHVTFIGQEGNHLLAGWNLDDYSGYYHYAYLSLGASLWYEDADNLRPPSADDRAKTSSAKPGLAIFPNPVRDRLQFSSNADPAQVAGIQLVNTKGEIVRDLTGENLIRSSLDVQDLPNGPYFFKMTMLDGTSLTRPFMVQRAR